MAETTENQSTQIDWKKLIHDGVRDALFERDTTIGTQEQAKSVRDQQVQQREDAKKSAWMDRFEGIVEGLADQGQKLIDGWSNQKGQNDLFGELSRSLSLMTRSGDAVGGTPSAGVQESGGNITDQIKSSMSEMNLSSSGGSSIAGDIGGLKKFFTSSLASSIAPQATAVAGTPGVQSVLGAELDTPKNDAANDRKMLIEEEDRAFKSTAKPVVSKLDIALDKYINGEGAGGGGSGDGGSGSLVDLVLGIVGGLGGAILGLGVGYLSRFGSMWGEIGTAFSNGIKAGWKTLKDWGKDTTVGKTLARWKNSFTKTIDSGIAKIGELKTSVLKNFEGLKSSFTGMLEGWKVAFKESKAGQLLSSARESLSKAGSWISNMGSKAINSFKNGTLMADTMKFAEKLPGVSTALRVAKPAYKFAKLAGKFMPHVQIAGGLTDAAYNTYQVIKGGGSVTDVMGTLGAGMVDTVADTLLIPEIMNTLGGAIGAAQSGGGAADIIMGAGKGLLAERDANDISTGTGLITNLQNFVGVGNEKTRRVAEAYNNSRGYDAAGVDVVTGSAWGLGHSAALYRPKAAGSMENNREPNADVTENMPNVEQMSESDKVNAYKEGVKEGVKEAMMSPEVQEANAQNAKATGKEINSTLFGG